MFNRSQSDMESGRIRTMTPRSNLESNCNEIFTRTPAMTKELLNRIQNAEVGPRKFVVFGREMRTRQISVLIALLILFILSCGIGFIFWGTTMFQTVVLQNLVISNQSQSYSNWLKQKPIRFHVYIFNYTNVEDVQAGYAKKPRVQEIGPFVYEVQLERVNVKFSDDGNVVSFQEKNTFKFNADLSKGRRQNERIIVPNIPLLGAAAMAKESFYFSRMALSGIFSSMNSKPFVTLPVDKFIFGYDDNLYNLAKGVMAWSRPLPFEKIGLLANRMGLSKDVMEVYTGKDDINKVGMIKSISKATSYDHWLNDDCNRIGGYEGALFSPEKVQHKKDINILVREFCRQIPYKFQKESTILNKIKTYRYTMPENVFGHPSVDNPSNQCYCDMDGGCTPHGLLNITKCSYGSPFFVSKPHFHDADPAIRESIEGLDANHQHHESFFELHPSMGFVTEGWTRIQTNIQVLKSPGIMQLSMFEDDIYLPIAWMEFGMNAADLSDDIKQIFYDSTYLVKGIELAFKCGSLLMGIVTLLGVLLVIRGNFCGDALKPVDRSIGDSRLIS